MLTLVSVKDVCLALKYFSNRLTAVMEIRLSAWRIQSGFGTQKKSPIPLNRGVPSIEVI